MRSSAFLPVLLFFALTLTCPAQNSLPPSWIYSTYFGGSQQDSINAATRDAAGNIYVTGSSSSPDFPTTGGVYEPAYPGPSGDFAIFVAKFSASGELIWSTFLGPGAYNYAGATTIQVDAESNVYVAGIFQDPGYPTTGGLPNSGVVFVTKLNSTGSQIVYSSLMGPNSLNAVPKLALVSSGETFVIGSGPAGDCCNATHNGSIGSLGAYDVVWVTEINPAGTKIPWSVEVGGNGSNDAYGAAIDSSNKLYIAGYTDAINFPHTPGALDQNGAAITFVVKLDPSRLPQGSLVYSALVGGSLQTNDFMEPESLAVDRSGNVYVGAWTYNIGLYTSKWAFQPKAAAVPNAYVFELNAAGSALLNGTYLGGSGTDYIGQVAVDGSGNTYVTGSTDSWDFPITTYGDVSSAVRYDIGFYAKLNPEFAAVSVAEFGNTLEASDDGWAALPDGAGGAWFGGSAGLQFPTTSNAFQPAYAGNYDGVLFDSDFAGVCDSDGVAICSIAADSGNSERVHFIGQASDMEDNVNIALAIDGLPVYSSHAAQFDSWLPVAAGNHVARVLAQNLDGSQSQSQEAFSVTASSACPVNLQSLTLTFCNPLNAAALKSPVTVQVQANDTIGISSIQLYVDGQLDGTMSGNNGVFTTTLSLAPGAHSFNAQGYDLYNNFMTTSAAARVTK